ncbi:hypothetical protein PHLGIDRAFT_105021 [Phlebiopsis gigantea 11061_1 CR5-6]|uniref:Cytochrome P450 n=1 Tax=Phlebiopsis gigantea (strain 11061_1 CR5-6) TaxID=745531 RepID=A0A0C3S942_PHLG1|nr:hypothetical protein PHLGIDRAFT_105021 [Phlebiopsis gigantea 11061_1 CR5-6]
MLLDLSLYQACLGVASASFVYGATRGVYNLYFHPLAKFPGPKWAAVTGWWKTYVEVYKGESIIDKLFELHKIYGPIVRITPNELHFSNPSVYHEIYNQRSRWNKDPNIYQVFGEDISTVSTLDYRDAKRRKELIAPHFSRKSVLQLQYVVQDGLNELCAVIRARCEAGKQTDIWRAFRCVSMDNITSYCFGYCIDAVHATDFKEPATEELHEGLRVFHVFKHFSFLKHIIVVLSRLIFKYKIAELDRPGYGRKNIRQIKGIIENPTILADAPHQLVYHTLLDPNASLKLSRPSLHDEAGMLVVAGVDTVSNSSTVATIWTATQGDPDRLRAELRAVWPRIDAPPSLEVLEDLPYLRAVCKEALRLSHGVYTPMLRIVPPEGATLGGQFVPGGTSVGISNLFVHLNPEIFPEPHKFCPERWLAPGAESLDTWLVAFSRGPRSCLGINLGWCELLMNTANIFRCFTVELGDCWPLFVGGENGPISPYELFHDDCYLPYYHGPDLLFKFTPIDS